MSHYLHPNYHKKLNLLSNHIISCPHNHIMAPQSSITFENAVSPNSPNQSNKHLSFATEQFRKKNRTREVTNRKTPFVPRAIAPIYLKCSPLRLTHLTQPIRLEIVAHHSAFLIQYVTVVRRSDDYF